MINNNEKISKDFTYHVDSLLRCVCIIHTSPSAISPRDLRTDFGRCPLETGTSDIHHGGCVCCPFLSLFFFHGATWISHLAGLFVSSLLRKGKKKKHITVSPPILHLWVSLRLLLLLRCCHCSDSSFLSSSSLISVAAVRKKKKKEEVNERCAQKSHDASPLSETHQ